jgi:hypothetical protein
MKIKLVKKKPSIKKKILASKDFFSKIQVNSKTFSSTTYQVAVNGNISIQRQMTIYSLLSNYINYPEILARNKIQGGVTANFILTKNGIYLEKLTEIDCKSRYLRVYVARRLRKAFSEVNVAHLKLKKMTKVKILIFFHLTQENNQLLKSGIYDNHIFLYRKQNGISSINDRINYTIRKTFGYINNILTLINDLTPDSEETKVKRIYELKSYEDDLFW